MANKSKLHPTSPEHAALLRELQARIQHSESNMKDRYQVWREQDEAQVAYIKPQERDRIARQNKKTNGSVDYVQVEIPYSYGMMMTAHTYWSTVFLGRDPVFGYTGRHGEPLNNSQALEALVGYQYTVGRMAPAMYIWLYDAAKYGVGVVGRYWDERIARYTETVEEPVTYLGMPTGKTKRKRVTKQKVAYAGNTLFNIRPYDIIRDPRVTYGNLEKGEYFGYRTTLSPADLINDEEQRDYINLEFLGDSRSGSQAEEGSDQLDWPEKGSTLNRLASDASPDFLDAEVLYVRIVPSKWNLGESKYPEIWAFTIADKRVIIQAKPLGEITDRLPFYAIESEIEGYSLFKRGIMESLAPLNDTMTWLFNSHYHNVRQALNNQFIYDPSALHAKDVLDPSPGKRIRLKPDAYGRTISQVFQQIPVADVTGRHLGEANNIGELMQRAGGINDSVMGMLDPGGRKTATEVRTTGASSLNRLKTVAEYMDVNGFEPLSMDLVKSSQQFYTGEQKFRIVGDLQVSEPFINVNEDSIAGCYDYVPAQGTLPVDRTVLAQLMQQLIGGIAGDPMLSQQFDIAGMITWAAQQAGLKNVKQFRINVMQPGQMPQQGSVPMPTDPTLPDGGQIL